MGPIQSADFYVEEDANLTPFSDVQRFYKYGPRGPQMISGFKIFTEKRGNLLVGYICFYFHRNLLMWGQSNYFCLTNDHFKILHLSTFVLFLSAKYVG